MESLDLQYKNLQISSLKSINSYTCMFLKNISNYKVDGSGVFFEIENNYFLVSAGHVLDNFEDLFIPLEDGKVLLKPGGEIFNSTAEDRDKDYTDLSFLKLDQESVEGILTTYRFLQEDDLAINHKFVNQEYYIFAGYPTTQSKFSKTSNSFHTYPFFHFTTPLNELDYIKHNRNSAFNVITSYDRKLCINFKKRIITNGPDLHGISGCGLWFTNPSDLLTGKVNPKLTAIMTDWPIKDRTVVIGTRIDVITEALRRHLNINFPESKVLGLK